MRFYTPEDLADHVVTHFGPTGRTMDPCRGRGAFYAALKRHRPESSPEWCEIDQGRDFFDWEQRVDWIVTNPPWGRLFAEFLQHSMAIADNVVFLANANVWMTKSRLGMLREHRFGIVEMLQVKTPEKPWPQSGFQLVATHIKRGWTGSIQLH